MAGASVTSGSGPEPALAALIVGNGDPPSPDLLRCLMAPRPLLLCADGGANAVAACGYVPDFIVGDLDSVAAAVRGAVPAGRVIRVDADDTGTDLQKALHHAVHLGVGRATLTGVTGRRTDHTLWNLGLLRRFGARLQLRIVDDYCEIRLVRGCVRFWAPLGQKVSLSPFSGAATGVWTQGLRFALRGESLAAGVRDGISNEVVASPVQVSVEAGDLLVVIQRDGGDAVCWATA
jgi:thiamine pyrophosphokinase